MDTYPIQYNKDYYVVVGNALIKGKQTMTLRESILLHIAISQVLAEDEDLKTYTTSVTELAAFMGINKNSLYRDLESICESLRSRNIKIKVGEGRTAKWKVFGWISSASYADGFLTLRLSDEIKPYIIGLKLKNYYSQSVLGVLLSFNKYYSVRLYQYLWADYGEHPKPIDYWEFTIDEIRELFQTGKKYSHIKMLIKKTILSALEELSESDYTAVWGYQEHHGSGKGSPLEKVSFHMRFFNNAEEKKAFLEKGKFNEIEEKALPAGEPHKASNIKEELLNLPIDMRPDELQDL